MGSKVRRTTIAVVLAGVLVLAGACSDDDGGGDGGGGQAADTSTSQADAPIRSDDERRPDVVALAEDAGLSSAEINCITDAAFQEMTSEDIDVLITIPPGADPESLTPEQLAVVQTFFQVAADVCQVNLLAS